ncbi:hypothetical protein BHT19_0023095 [[Kluyvera] intestini]|nr:hypothetical protein BHT19_0023095 [[Kluyvera] intestini]
MVFDMNEFQRFIEDEAPNIKLTSPALEKSYWSRDKLESVTIGDDNPDLIFHAVGLALTQWETLENAIFELYSIFCGCDNPLTTNALRRMLGAIESSDGRRKALEEAARIYFGDHNYPDGIAKPYKLLFASHKKASDRRNEIAHGIVHGFVIDNENKGNFLFPARYNSGRNTPYMDASFGENGGQFMTEMYRYTSREIYAIAQKFGVLTAFTFECMVAAGKIEGKLKIELAQLAQNNIEK